MGELVKGHIIFDHDGTLVKVANGRFQLFPGMEKLLLELKEQNFALYVWTARPRHSALDILNKLNVVSLFNDFFCYGDGSPKPDVEGLEKLTGGLDKKKILHIGDSMSDIEGAEAYGIDVVAACWNDLEQKKYFINKTKLIATTIEECQEIIRGKYV